MLGKILGRYLHKAGIDRTAGIELFAWSLRDDVSVSSGGYAFPQRFDDGGGEGRCCQHSLSSSGVRLETSGALSRSSGGLQREQPAPTSVLLFLAPATTSTDTPAESATR
nr:hypothetical protein Iba_chr13dCG8850 [Ipomoea batatas]